MWVEVTDFKIQLCKGALIEKENRLLWDNICQIKHDCHHCFETYLKNLRSALINLFFYTSELNSQNSGYR
jgi:hypothetical protein